MSFLDDVSIMYDTYSASCGSLTDIVFMNIVPIEGNPDIRGITYCVRWRSLGVCEQYWVGINPFAIFDQGGPYELNTIKTIRHEIGHTTGLRHSGDLSGNVLPYAPDNYRAMKSGPVPDDLYFTAYEPVDHLLHIFYQYQ